MSKHFRTAGKLFQIPRTKAEQAANIPLLQHLPILDKGRPIVCCYCGSAGFKGLHLLDRDLNRYACNDPIACKGRMTYKEIDL